MAAARELAATKPLDQISLAEVARQLGISWPTVRRHVGDAKQLRALLADQQPPGLSHVDTRGRILQAAATIFARHGYSEATLDQVAAEAGLTKGSVYWHFASKSDLFLTLLDVRIQAQLAGFPALIQTLSQTPDFQSGLASVLTLQFQSFLADPDWPRLFLEFASRSRERGLQERLAGYYLAIREALSTEIKRMQAEGLIASDIDPVALAILYTAMLDGLMEAWVIDPVRIDPPALASSLARLLWQGARPNPSL